MAEVTITINGRQYRISCEDGQEEHVAALGRKVDDRVRELVQSVGQVGDARLLVMASLLIADELADAKRAIEEARDMVGARHAEVDDLVAQRLESLAQRLERVAAGLEAA